jgi:hypothetical protein
MKIYFNRVKMNMKAQMKEQVCLSPALPLPKHMEDSFR